MIEIDLSRLFARLADRTRLRLVTLLSNHDELCVCEPVHALDDIQPKVSRHLAMLRRCGLVSGAREGARIHCRPAPTLPPWAEGIVRLAASASATKAPYGTDRAHLASLPGRPTPVHFA